LLELARAETEEERLLEAGDVLFVAVNIVRRYGVDAEQALRASNAKFERRFREMERLSEIEGQNFTQLDLDTQEAYWQRAKGEIG
jgi:ATP diphosphatase